MHKALIAGINMVALVLNTASMEVLGVEALVLALGAAVLVLALDMVVFLVSVNISKPNATYS